MSRWTEADIRGLLNVPRGATATPQKQSKYRNKSVVVDGIRFDSQLEARHYRHLTLLWQAGQVLWFVRQVNFDLEGGVRYRADFVVVESARVRVQDTTGVMTQTKINKLKQVKARYGIDVEIVKAA